MIYISQVNIRIGCIQYQLSVRIAQLDRRTILQFHFRFLCHTTDMYLTIRRDNRKGLLEITSLYAPIHNRQFRFRIDFISINNHIPVFLFQREVLQVIRNTDIIADGSLAISTRIRFWKTCFPTETRHRLPVYQLLALIKINGYRVQHFVFLLFRSSIYLYHHTKLHFVFIPIGDIDRTIQIVCQYTGTSFYIERFYNFLYALPLMNRHRFVFSRRNRFARRRDQRCSRQEQAYKNHQGLPYKNLHIRISLLSCFFLPFHPFAAS